MDKAEKFLSNRKRYQPISLPRDFSDEEMARDWTLSENDKQEIEKYRKSFRTLIAVQLCSIRLYGRFLRDVNELSPRIVNYINVQFNLPPTLLSRFLKERQRITNSAKISWTTWGFVNSMTIQSKGCCCGLNNRRFKEFA